MTSAAGVTTQDGVRGLYERIGRLVPGYHGAYETSAAAEAGSHVWREVVSSLRVSASSPATRRPEDR